MGSGMAPLPTKLQKNDGKALALVLLLAVRNLEGAVRGPRPNIPSTPGTESRAIARLSDNRNGCCGTLSPDIRTTSVTTMPVIGIASAEGTLLPPVPKAMVKFIAGCGENVLDLDGSNRLWLPQAVHADVVRIRSFDPVSKRMVLSTVSASRLENNRRRRQGPGLQLLRRSAHRDVAVPLFDHHQHMALSLIKVGPSYLEVEVCKAVGYRDGRGWRFSYGLSGK